LELAKRNPKGKHEMKNERGLNWLVIFTTLFPVAFLVFLGLGFYDIRFENVYVEVDIVFRILPQGFLLSFATLLIFDNCID